MLRRASPARVIVGVEDSYAGLHALRRAAAEARLRGVALHAVRAWTAPVSWAGPMPAAPVNRHEAAQAAIQVVADAFDTAMGGVPKDLDVKIANLEGQVGRVLVSYAGECDLLVIGSGCRGGVTRWLGGSVARYCVRRATCPVLVVPPPELATAGMRGLRRAMHRAARQMSEPTLERREPAG